MRLRLLDFRLSDGPRVVGICKENQRDSASIANRAQRRLIYAKEANSEGWWGSFAEVSFNNVSRLEPYLTLPRQIARVEMFDVCEGAIPVHNQYVEYLQFGNGRMPHRCRQNTRWTCLTEAYMRNNAVTFVRQSVFPCILRVYATSQNDIDSGKRLLIQGLDHADNVIYSDDNAKQVTGMFMDFDSPFADFPIQLNQINGFQKDVTEGQIQIFQVDPTTGTQTLLLTMEPGETVADYRRYYLHNLPRNCCRIQNLPVQPVRVTAIAKLELIPVVADTDYFLIQNLEALIEECQSIRLSEMDNTASQQLALVHHTNAIRLLSGELAHYLGKQNPAVSFLPFGSAKLERQHVGMM
jgi:hypothetical protein